MNGIQLMLEEEQIRQVVQAMRNLEKSEESVFKTAVNNTANRAQKLLARQAKKIYGGEASEGILERSSIKKATVSSLGARILYRSTQPDITKFRVSVYGRSPTPILWENKKRVPFPISVQQLKSAPLKELSGKNGMAFAVRFSNGKLAIVRRTGKKTNTELLTKKGKKSKHKRDQLRGVMGSSDRSMVRNKKVYGAVQGKIGDILNQQCQKALQRALAGGKK